ncbi:MAG: phosphate signaling complex protein PhoU [Magnetococcales bacterium]|nr:phosphate signaling complex protein PhoU [Magnetococcales bacterium]MBF0116361.1 phosphate signaling complex protein PhoU [Magnetococcales bacterium]
MPVYEQKLQNDITSIRGEILTLGEMVSRALADSLQALLQGDYALAHLTVLRDFPINRHCLRLNKQCHSFIARHLPSAGHLRLVTSVMQMILELERVGDYARTIARETIHMHTIPSGILQRDLQEMGQHAQEILHKSLAAFAKEDVALARSMLHASRQVGQDLHRLYEDLTVSCLGEGGRETAIRLLDLHSIAYMLERVANRATNICEAVLFILAGESVPVRLHEIAFLDSGNGSLSTMAECLARKGYGEVARFRSAALHPGTPFHPDMRQFMEQHGFSLPGVTGNALLQLLPELHDLHVLISLNGPITPYGLTIPFHCTVLEWPIGQLSAQQDGGAIDTMHQALVVHLAELMAILVGEEGA